MKVGWQLAFICSLWASPVIVGASTSAAHAQPSISSYEADARVAAAANKSLTLLQWRGIFRFVGSIFRESATHDAILQVRILRSRWLIIGKTYETEYRFESGKAEVISITIEGDGSFTRTVSGVSSSGYFDQYGNPIFEYEYQGKRYRDAITYADDARHVLLGYVLTPVNGAPAKWAEAFRFERKVISGAEADAILINGPAAVAAAKASISPVVQQQQPTSVTNITSAQQKGPRVALVIGNSRYDASMGPLLNPARDAELVAKVLRAAGFEVELLLDADQKTMKRSISNLGQRMAALGRGATGLFFYAGHGLQSRGVNYLIPIGAAIQTEADVDLEAVAADTVLSQMEEAGASTNIIILDACRNTPVLRRFRGGLRGLARMEAPNGSFISYSTAPGSVAADGEGANSPFASALAQQIAQSGLPIEVMFRNVRREVIEQTNGLQTPWDSSSLTSSFEFVPG